MENNDNNNPNKKSEHKSFFKRIAGALRDAAYSPENSCHRCGVCKHTCSLYKKKQTEPEQ